jgi:hypothetical protein
VRTANSRCRYMEIAANRCWAVTWRIGRWNITPFGHRSTGCCVYGIVCVICRPADACCRCRYRSAFLQAFGGKGSSSRSKQNRTPAHSIWRRLMITVLGAALVIKLLVCRVCGAIGEFQQLPPVRSGPSQSSIRSCSRSDVFGVGPHLEQIFCATGDIVLRVG